MAADDTDEIDDQQEDADEIDEIDEEDLDDDELDATPADDDDEIKDDDEEEEKEEDKSAKPKSSSSPSASDDDDDEEELGPDDVEDDLDTILKGKITAEDDLGEDDEDEDEPLVVPVKKTAVEQADGVTARQEGEFTCPGCFMVVHPRQFGRRSNPTCPSGEEDCPGIEIAFGTS